MDAPSSSLMPVFEVAHLTKTYHVGDVDVHALRDVSLDLPEREFVVLLGPSGSGKSTLLNILGGLDVPTSGQVFYRDTELTKADEAALTAYRRRHVGFVFQFYNLIPSLTALENVALVTEIAERPDDAGGGASAWSNLDHARRSFSRATVGRRAAARRHRPRDRQAAGGAAVRRADRRARHLDGHRRARSAGARQRRAWDDDGRDHAQCGHRGDGRSGGPARRRASRPTVEERTAKLAPRELSW